MKVNFAATPISAFDRIRTADSAGDAPKRDSREQPREKKEESETDSGREFSEMASDTLATAVDAFGREGMVVANGLSANVEGQGPGLRVTLKDGRGALVRQFTGEEFLRLREAATGTVRGSLLDKKL